MLAVMTLFPLFTGLMVLCAVAAAGAFLLKIAFKIVFIPLKLLLLPLALVAVAAKFAILIAFGAALLAVIIPLLVVGALLATPFLLVAVVR